MRTPWGQSDSEKTFGDGITLYGTPSHGGFHLLAKQNAKVPECFRKATWGGLGTSGWYEEDCDVCFVMLVFPELFNPEEVAGARTIVEHYHSEALKQFDARLEKP